jgi:hypothetical protein
LASSTWDCVLTANLWNVRDSARPLIKTSCENCVDEEAVEWLVRNEPTTYEFPHTLILCSLTLTTWLMILEMNWLLMVYGCSLVVGNMCWMGSELASCRLRSKQELQNGISICRCCAFQFLVERIEAKEGRKKKVGGWLTVTTERCRVNSAQCWKRISISFGNSLLVFIPVLVVWRSFIDFVELELWSTQVIASKSKYNSQLYMH